MNAEIDSSARLVVIPVGLGKYSSPRPPISGRTAFKTLQHVDTDLRRLGRLFAKPQFVAAGCRLLRRISGTRDEVTKRLDAVVNDIALLPPPRPTVCLLWAGHAVPMQAHDLRLATRDSYQPMRGNDGLDPRHLVNTLAAAGAPAVYVILDVCRAGTAAIDLVTTAIQRMTDRPPDPGQRSPRFAFLCSAQAYEDAKDGVFGAALVTLLRQGPSASAQELIDERGYGSLSPNDSMLTPRTLGAVLDAEFQVLKSTNDRIQQPVAYDLNSDFPVFPNPLWSGSARPRLMSQTSMDKVPVVKRTPVVEGIIEFAAEPASAAPLLLVTGQPGAGTSTVLRTMASIHNASWSRRRPIGLPHVDATVDLYRRSRTDVMRDIVGSLSAGTSASFGDDLSFREIVGLRQSAAGRPLTVILDGLKDAADPSDITADVIQPLVEEGSRVVIGTGTDSPDWLRLIDRNPKVLHVDLASDPAIDNYLEERLVAEYGTGRQSTKVVESLSDKAQHRFLYAELALDHLKARSRQPSPATIRALPDDVGDLFDLVLEDLDEAMAKKFDVQRGASTLALGLAWSAGQGVPRHGGLWAMIAAAAARRDDSLTDLHIDWFLRAAGRYVLETSEHGQAVYRLANTSLAINLREDDESAGSRVATALVAEIHQSTGWANANPYIAAAMPWYLDKEPERFAEVANEPGFPVS